MDATNQEGPDPRVLLMRHKKADLVEKVIELSANGETLQDELAGARTARHNAIKYRDDHKEGLALARVLNALEHLEGRDASPNSGRMVLHHYSGPTSPDPYVPGPAERVLRHAWLAAGLPDPAAECDRLRDQLREARRQAADAEERLERVRQLGAGEEPSY